MSVFTNVTEANITNVDLDIRDITSVSDSITAVGPLTDTELRATPVPVTIPTPVPVTDNAGSLTVDGTVSVSGSVAVTGPLTDTELRATPVPVSGTVSTTPVVATTSTVTQITSNGLNQTLLSPNSNRRQSILFFESGIWFVKLGVTASATSFTYKIAASNTSIEIPSVWQGQIDVLCTTSGKLVDVTELTN